MKPLLMDLSEKANSSAPPPSISIWSILTGSVKDGEILNYYHFVPVVSAHKRGTFYMRLDDQMEHFIF